MKHFDISNNPDSDSHNNLNKIKNGPWLVLLHANWCPHCRNMDADWDEVSNSNTNFNTMRIESEVKDKAPNMISNMPINGFPTMVMLNNGKKVGEYNGDRSSEDILNFGNTHCKLKRGGGRRSIKRLSKRANKRSLKNRRRGGGLTRSMEVGLERLDSLLGNLHNHNNRV